MGVDVFVGVGVCVAVDVGVLVGVAVGVLLGVAGEVAVGVSVAWHDAADAGLRFTAEHAITLHLVESHTLAALVFDGTA